MQEKNKKLNKYGYIDMPECKNCIYLSECKHNVPDCTKYTGWVSPCLQGCIFYLDNCYIYRYSLLKNSSIFQCKKFKK